MNLEKKEKLNFNELYVQNEKMIKKYCCLLSRYYNLNYEDLYSESNEIFLNCTKKYKQNQISFSQFLKKQMITYLHYYCKSYYNRILSKEIKIMNKLILEFNRANKNIPNIDESIQKIKNNILSISDEINQIIIDIIEFCIKPNMINELKPYMKKTKNRKQKYALKPSKYAIKYYFNENYGYSHQKMEKAFQGISVLLQKDLI